MSKSEIGDVIAILKDTRPIQYRLRLHSGEIVIVTHDQVSPVRMTLLAKGMRLRVTHDLGRVQSASTDLSLIVPGRVRSLRRSATGTSYRIDLDQGDAIELHGDRITGHPDRPLHPGARVDVQFEDRQVRSARLVSEREAAEVAKIDLRQGIVQVVGAARDRYTVRLPLDVLHRLSVGEAIEIEIQYSPEGERKVVIEKVGSRQSTLDSKQRSAFSSQPSQGGRQFTVNSGQTGTKSEPAGPVMSRTGEKAGQGTVNREPFTVDSGTILGIDPAVLARLKKEKKHRFEILSWLEQHGSDGLVEWYRLRDGTPARFATPARPLSEPIQRAVQATQPGFAGFFQHQAGALDAIRAERNLVIVTQTASGKTLSYNPALFEYLLQNPSGHVLYVFPLNALMMDQKEKIDELVRALGQRGGSPVSAEMLVGGMGTDKRAEIARNAPNILATNPEMLSVMLGEAQTKWRAFFSGLKYIVLDEVHTYRGLFGVHMSGLMRRLRLVAQRCGSDPRFILCSATVSNPVELAARLTALKADRFHLIDEQQDGSQQRDKHWTVINPDWGSRSPRANTYQEVAAAVFCELLGRKNAQGRASPLNTILFCRSIREVNRISRLVRQRLEREAPLLKDKVKTYISAELTVDARREIYEGLRSGRYLGVISTNALEAGIDIGALDACIITGFPFSVMALRQMAGRVGRKDEGLVCFIPYPLSSLDGYYRDHPSLLLSQPPEVFVVDPQNPYIARKHVNAAANESGGLTDGELEALWGERARKMAAQAQEDGVMRRAGARWMGTRRSYSDANDPYAVQSLRSGAQQPYAVCLDDNQPCDMTPACYDPAHRRCMRRVTALDRQYIYRDCHPGAIYEAADGKLYRVTKFDDAHRVVRVAELPDETTERTRVEEDLVVEMAGATRAERTLAPGIRLAWGDVTVRRQFTGYYSYQLLAARRCRRCRKDYDETIDACPTCGRPTEVFYSHTRRERRDFPTEYALGFTIVLKTTACWLSVQPELENRLETASPCKLPGEQNRLLRWLRQPLDLSRLDAGPLARLHITADEKKMIADYHARASEALKGVKPTAMETVLFPGVYGQCLMSAVRSFQHSAVSSQKNQNPGSKTDSRQPKADGSIAEARALELFQAVTGYPVTDDLRHICRKCQTSTLFPALHTLEHVVDARYPSVALGDRSDLGAFSTLGHSGTGAPTVFWFDSYEGGLGAAEKVFDQFARLLEAGLENLDACACTTLEGCPRCSYLPDCSEGNEELSKLAGTLLMRLVLGSQAVSPVVDPLRPFVYRKKRAVEFDRSYQDNEYASVPHGVGSEAPGRAATAGAQGAAPGPRTGGSASAQSTTPQMPDPYSLMRLQRRVHSVVAKKAYEARSHEIDAEVPPVSAAELNTAYQGVMNGMLMEEWKLEPGRSPYETLEVLPEASLKMIQQIYRAIALQVHPDANPGHAEWANEMMKRLNAAYDRILKEKSRG
jgi:DEAD/DEAH box helicase domain-containing protein